MSVKKVLLWIVLLDFALFSGWVMWQVGYMGIWQAGLSSPGALQILFDLVIMCMLFCSWLIADAKARGVTPWPWVVATIFLGSLSPLTYLLVREYGNRTVTNLASAKPVYGRGE